MGTHPRRGLPVRILLLVLFLAVGCGAASAAVHPSEVEKRLKKEEQRLDRIQGQLQYHRKQATVAAKQAKGVVVQLEQINQKLVVTEQKMTVLELRKSKVVDRMGFLVREIRSTGGRIEEVKGLLRQRLVAVYKYGGVAEFNLLLSAGGAQEALATSYLLGRIAEQDRGLIRELSDRKTRLSQAHVELKERKADLESKNRELQGQKVDLRSTSQARGVLLERLKRESSAHLEAVRELERAEEEIQATVKRLLAEKKRLLAQQHPGRAPVVYYRGGRLAWPLRGRIMSPFGTRVHPIFRTRIKHTGIDIDGRTGDPVRAAGAGEVLFTGWLRGYGQVIIVDHGNNLTTVYAHLSRIETREGETVKMGDLIGRVGATGVATGSHLHFEVRINGNAVNPMGYL
jgi:murein DD-endopeptidase MepM/ murein hydrolase activator NlpD